MPPRYQRKTKKTKKRSERLADLRNVMCLSEKSRRGTERIRPPGPAVGSLAQYRPDVPTGSGDAESPNRAQNTSESPGRRARGPWRRNDSDGAITCFPSHFRVGGGPGDSDMPGRGKSESPGRVGRRAVTNPSHRVDGPRPVAPE